MGILDGVPDGELAGMHPCEGLAAVGCIPEIGLMIGVDHSRAAHHAVVIAGEKEATVFSQVVWSFGCLVVWLFGKVNCRRW